MGHLDRVLRGIIDFSKAQYGNVRCDLCEYLPEEKRDNCRYRKGGECCVIAGMEAQYDNWPVE